MNEHQTQNEVAAGMALISRHPKLISISAILTFGLGLLTAFVSEPIYESRSVIKLGRSTNWANYQLKPQNVMETGELIDDLRARYGLTDRDPNNRPMPRIESVTQTLHPDRHILLTAFGKSGVEVEQFLKGIVDEQINAHAKLTSLFVNNLQKRQAILERRDGELRQEEARNLERADDSALDPGFRSQHIVLATQTATARRANEENINKLQLLAGPFYNHPTTVLIAPAEGHEIGQSSLLVRGVLSLVLGCFFGILLAFLRDLSTGKL